MGCGGSFRKSLRCRVSITSCLPAGKLACRLFVKVKNDFSVEHFETQNYKNTFHSLLGSHSFPFTAASLYRNKRSWLFPENFPRYVEALAHTALVLLSWNICLYFHLVAVAIVPKEKGQSVLPPIDTSYYALKLNCWKILHTNCCLPRWI